MSSACAALVQSGDPDRFAAVMAAPPAVRPGLFVLYAANLEVARAPYLTDEPMIAEMRLQWWRDVVANAASGAARAHEVAAPLHALIAEGRLAADLLDRLIAARRWDCWRAAHADEAALDAYLLATGGGLMQLAVQVAGGDAGPAADAGWATGLAGYLRAVPALEARGRVPLIDGRPQAVAALARRGLACWARARGALGPGYLAGWQTGAILGLAARDPAAVSEGRLDVSEFRRRGSLLWQSWRGRV